MKLTGILTFHLLMGVASVKLMFVIIFSFETVLVSSPVL